MGQERNRKSLWGAGGIILLASLLIFYAFTLEQQRMIGDEAGHDPGSRALPLGSGIVMLIAGLYDLGKQLRTGQKPRMQQEKVPSQGAGQGTRAKRMLFWGTLFGSILYLLLLERVGFLILTTLFLYFLFFFYGREGEKEKGEYMRKGTEKGPPLGSEAGGALKSSVTGANMIKGGILAFVLVTICYGVGRIVSRELFYYGRSVGSSVLASRAVSTVVFFLCSAGVYGGTLFLGQKTSFWKIKTIKWSILLSVGTALVLFLVFRMIFRVALPLGILDL